MPTTYDSRGDSFFQRLAIRINLRLYQIRRALTPIYDNLEDHESVYQRAPVPGMGDVSSFFFSHKVSLLRWLEEFTAEGSKLKNMLTLIPGKARESNDSQMSKVNHDEADMVSAFYLYLSQNSTKPSDMTVLTYYNAQRKLILRKLREHPTLRDERLKVVTVDSYQGEENAIVLLSLVRSNEGRKIGFLENRNRICVALSRAQRGLYIFGDAENLSKSSMLWYQVIQRMAQKPCRVGFNLPLECSNHGNVTFVKGKPNWLI